jgi:transposase
MIYAYMKDNNCQQEIDQQLKATENKKWYRRLMIISLSAKRYTVKKLQEMFQLSDATIRRYIHAYNQDGISGLRPNKATGRPSKIAHFKKEDWDKVLEKTPNQYEKLNTCSRQWTLLRLAKYVKEYHQIQVCLATIYNSLRKTGRRTGRSKLRVGSPDPGYDDKRTSIEELRSLAGVEQLTSDAIKLITKDNQLTRLSYPEIIVPKRCGRLFFFDEANVSWCPQTGRVYRIVGEQAKVDSPGKNQRKYLLGSLEYPTGAGLYEIYSRKRHEEVQKHWEHLLEMYEDDFLFVVRDNAKSHTTPDLDAFLLDHQERLCLVAMPTYSPHLNLIERLWHYMRDNITRSHFYKTFKELCQSLMQWLEKLPFKRFQSLMGIEVAIQ